MGIILNSGIKYLSQIRIIRAYCESRSISLPPIEHLTTEEVNSLIEATNNFDELFEVLDKLERIEGESENAPPQYFYAHTLKKIIDEVRSGNIDIKKITRTGKLRQKVIELLALEQIK